MTPVYDGFVLRKGASARLCSSRTALLTLSRAQPSKSSPRAAHSSPKSSSPASNPNHFPLRRTTSSRQRRRSSPTSRRMRNCGTSSSLASSRRLADLSCPRREDRLPNPSDPNAATTPSYHRLEEMRLMHELKESVCEVMTPSWDDK